MAASLGFSAYAHHAKTIQENSRTSMHRAVGVHQVASLGFILLSLKGTPLIPFGTLCVATSLFPFVIYYQNIKCLEKTMFSKLVPKGGMLHMVFWLMMAYYFSPESKAI